MREITIDGVEYILTPKNKDYGWRLPSIRELKSLVNYDKNEPACDIKDTKNRYYWSITPYVFSTIYAWVVNFYNGTDGYDDKSNDNFVRAVRETKNGLEWSKSSDIEMTYDEALEWCKTLTDEDVYKG
jgi:hypothetical protein